MFWRYRNYLYLCNIITCATFVALTTPILKVSQSNTGIPFPKEIKQKGYSFRPIEILYTVVNKTCYERDSPDRPESVLRV